MLRDRTARKGAAGPLKQVVEQRVPFCSFGTPVFASNFKLRLFGVRYVGPTPRNKLWGPPQAKNNWSEVSSEIWVHTWCPEQLLGEVIVDDGAQRSRDAVPDCKLARGAVEDVWFWNK